MWTPATDKWSFDGAKPTQDVPRPQRQADDEERERLIACAGIPLDRLREMCEAERDGRCVVLPCKVGDTVYEARYIHKCSRCPNNHVGRCLYDGQDVECPRSISKVIETPFTSDCFSLHTMELKRGIYLTRSDAEAALQRD